MDKYVSKENIQKMIKEQLFFLEIISDYLNNRRTERNTEIDWNILLDIASKQQLQSLVYYQCKESITDTAILNKLKSINAFLIYTSVNRKKMIRELTNTISASGIEISLVKGFEIEPLYRPAYLRSMGDTDIIIHKDDREEIHEIMIREGFECKKQSGDEWYYYKDNHWIEIHDSMIHPHEGNENLIAYFNDLWNHGQLSNDYFKLDWNFHFCYLIQHISGHLLFTGIGFRQFLDLLIVIQNVQLDWTKIEKTLKELNLWEFAVISFGLCQKWFCYNIELDLPVINTNFYNDVTERLFADGIFGQYNVQNKNIASYMDFIFYKKKSILKSHFLIKLRRIFPRYEKLSSYPYCKFLENNKILLPIAWVWRIIYRLFINKSAKKKEPVDNDSLIEKINLLKEWGL